MIYEGITDNQIYYDTKLASSEGVICVLYITKGTSKEEIQRAKSQLRNERDIVKFIINKI